MNLPTAISLFSGAVDGLAIAAQAAGFNVTHHVEWDAWCCRVLRMNHPNSIVINEDIHHVRNLPSTDVIFGGSPCQDFSIAGARRGFSGERYLWPEMLRIVRECQPYAVIHENVRGGVSAGLLDQICDGLESIGYETKALVYPASVFGAPHERYRMFIVGLMAYASSQRRNEPESKQKPDHNKYGINSASERTGRAKFHATLASGENMEQWLPQPGMAGNPHGTAPRLHGFNPLIDFPGWPAGQGVYQHAYEPARTTPQKGKYAKERIQALGNAVVWQQAIPLFEALKQWFDAKGSER